MFCLSGSQVAIHRVVLLVAFHQKINLMRSLQLALSFWVTMKVWEDFCSSRSQLIALLFIGSQPETLFVMKRSIKRNPAQPK